MAGLHLTRLRPQIITIVHEKLETQKERETNQSIRTKALLKWEGLCKFHTNTGATVAFPEKLLCGHPQPRLHN